MAISGGYTYGSLYGTPLTVYNQTSELSEPWYFDIKPGDGDDNMDSGAAVPGREVTEYDRFNASQLQRVIDAIDKFGQTQRMGLGDSAFEVVAVFYSNATGIETWKAALENLQGTIVTIVNDLGKVFANCLVVNVSNMRSKPARMPGTSITQRGEIAIRGFATQ